MRQHLVVARLLDVENFSLERKDCLEAAVASLLGGATCGFALDEEQFAAVGLAFGAVGEFAGQASAIERAFAAGQVAGFAGGFASAGGVNGLVDDLAGDGGVLFEERAQLFVDERLHDAGDVGIQLALGLPFELRLRQLHADHGDQAFAHVVAGQIFFDVFEQAHLLAGVVDGAGQRSAEAGEMRAAVDSVDVVGEAEDGFGVAVVVLQADFHDDAVFLGFHVDRLVVQDLFAAIEVLNELRDAAVVLEVGVLGFAGLRIGRPLVGQRNEQAFVQEGELAQPLGQRVVVVFGGGEDALVRQEVNLGPGLGFHGTRLLQLAGGFAFGVGLLPRESVTPDFEFEVFAQGVHAGDADAVQTAGNLVGRRIEFSAGVQLGHHDLRGRDFLAIDVHVVDGNAAAVVDDSDGVVDVDGDVDLVGVSGERFVDRVVDDFVDQMVQVPFRRSSRCTWRGVCGRLPCRRAL